MAPHDEQDLLDDALIRRVVHAATHVSRFRWWYAATVAWALVLALVPVVRDEDASPAAAPDQVRLDDPAAADPGPSPTPGSSTAEVAAPATPRAPSPPDAGGTAAGAIPAPAASGHDPGTPATPGPGGTGTTPPAPATGNGTGTSGGDTDPSGGDGAAPAGGTPGVGVPPPPSLPYPGVPEEADAALALAGPVAGQVCGGVTLVAVVLAVAGPSADPVPAGDLLPWMAPLFQVCAELPRPDRGHECPPTPLDDAAGEASRQAGVPLPAPGPGLALDEIDAVEEAAGGTSGGATSAAPDGSDELAGVAGCTPPRER